jgi:hypothetical protein
VQTSGSDGWLCFAAVAAPEAAHSSRCRLHCKGSDDQVLWVSAKSCAGSSIGSSESGLHYKEGDIQESDRWLQRQQWQQQVQDDDVPG